jgi:hypothetical protein
MALACVRLAHAQAGGGVIGGGGGGGGGGNGCSTSGTAMLKGNNAGGCANANAGADYAPPTSGTAILKANSGGFANATAGTDYAPATSGTSLLKGNNAGGFANATSGTDYAPATSGTSLLKGNNTGGFANASAGTDYQSPISGNTLATHHFANSINSSGTLAGPQPACGDISGAAASCGTNASELTSGTVPAARGGAGALNGILKANGAGTVSAATSSTDYAPATSGSTMLKGNGTGGFSNAVSGNDYAPATTGTSILKASSGGFANATAGTDYAPATNGTSILKGNNAGGFSNAVAATDYAPATSGTAILKANNAGGFANAVSGTDYQAPIAGNTLPANNFATSINTAGTIAGTRPACANLSDAAASCSTDTTNADNIGSGTLGVGQGGTNLGSGTSGGILGFTASGTLASSGVLSANNPVIGGGAGATPSSGFRSGNTTTFATTTGTLVNGHYAGFDANGNIVDKGIITNTYATIANSSGTSVTAVCSATSGSNPSRDMIWQVLTGATAYNTPALASGCIEGDIIEAYFIQGDNQGYQVTPAAGAGTTLVQPGIYAVPTSNGTGQGLFLHLAYQYHSNTKQWELLGQSTNPITPIPASAQAPNNDVTAVTVSVSSTPVNLAAPTSGHSLQNITMTVAATLNLPICLWTGQEMLTNTCQDSGGSHTPTFAGVSGVIVKGTYPTPTLTASKCDLCNWVCTATNGTSTTTWQFGSCAQNE